MKQTLALAAALMLSASIAPVAAEEAAPPATQDKPADTLLLTFGGDLGLGASGAPVRPDGALRHGSFQTFSEMTSGIAPLIKGDLNFANLETVVTDRNDLPALEKTFTFRSHPAGVRHLVRTGFNVFSTANNHAIDYGVDGIVETLRHLAGMMPDGLLAAPGIGLDREEAAEAAVIAVKGVTVGLSAIGIGGIGGSSESPRGTMLRYGNEADFRATLEGLIARPADLRILSVHYGAEGSVRPAATDVARLRDEAVVRSGVDIVVGHHAHVAAGVQAIGDRVVLYGLGNLLHPGMQNMAVHGLCRDYGLFVRIRAGRGPDGRMRPMVLDAVPLTDMHVRAEPLSGAEAAARIDVLNYLATGLDHADSGAVGVRFSTLPDGSGRHCLPGAATGPESIRAMCRELVPPRVPPGDLRRRIAASCDRVGFAHRGGGVGRSVADGQGEQGSRRPGRRSLDSSSLADAPSITIREYRAIFERGRDR